MRGVQITDAYYTDLFEGSVCSFPASSLHNTYPWQLVNTLTEKMFPKAF